MPPSTVYCDNCGAANRPQARFCNACGEPMAAVSSPGAASSTGLLPSQSLLKGRYLIISRLGQGGMGAVYKAQDTQLGNRPVAVKEMSQKGLDQQELAEAAEAFRREAHLLAGLFHRHLPRIYDHFSDAGRWYLVMDYITGETLENYLDKAGGKLPVEEVVDVGIQLCAVLNYLHSHQPPVIFRDLKPANVIRTPDGDLFLIDFGIARFFKPGKARDTVAYGSGGYAAPEQYGKGQTTPQSDIYSLGATLHQLLTGDDPAQTPFRFAPLSGAAPVGLGTLIAQMVEMDAGKRPASMGEIKQALQRLPASHAGSQLPATASASVPPPQPPVVSLPKVRPKRQKSKRHAPPPQPPVVSSSPLPQPVAVSPPRDTLLLTYRGHTGLVQAITWSPDGKRIASGSSDQTVQVWDAATGKLLFTYHGHAKSRLTGWVKAVAWSPDGRRIASGSDDENGVHVWDATSGNDHSTFLGVGLDRGPDNWVQAVAWSPDSRRLVWGNAGYVVQIQDISTAQYSLSYRGHAGAVNAVAWSPDGKRIASGSSDHTVQVWDVATGKNLLTYTEHTREKAKGGVIGGVCSVVWSPDGTRIASGGSDKTVQVWDAATGKNLLTYAEHTDRVAGVAWSPDSKRIASGSWDGTVQVWDVATGVSLFGDHRPYMVLAVAWSPDGRCIAWGRDFSEVGVWQAP